MAKKKKKENKLFRNIIFLVLIVLILSASYIFFKYNSDSQNLNFSEKQWVEKNKEVLIDVDVPNNINILGYQGEGILFDYLKQTEIETGLSFNKVSYNYPSEIESNDVSIEIVSPFISLNDDQLFIQDDNYVLVSGSETNYFDCKTLVNKKIGVIAGEKAIFSNLASDYGFSLSEHNGLNNLIKALSEKEINYILVPRYFALKDIVNNNLFINYEFENISNKIVLNVNDNKTLKSILLKKLNVFKEDFYSSNFKNYYMDFYVENKNVTDLDKTKLNNKKYVYGYIEGNGYNILENDQIYGLAGYYIDTMKDMANMEFEYVGFSKASDLQKALKNKTVDIAFVNYIEEDNENNAFLNGNFSIYALSEDYKNIVDLNGVFDKKLIVNGYSNLYNFAEGYSEDVEVNKSKRFTIDEDEILLVDNIDYMFNSNYLSKYYVLFNEEYVNNSYFSVIDDDVILYNFAKFVTSYSGYNEFKENSILVYNSEISDSDNILKYYIDVILFIFVLLAFGISFIFFREKAKVKSGLKKEDSLKYNDILTSLKNRNYLNDNISVWDETKIFPRTIIIMDLNNLKYVNDNYGHEEGNKLIQAAAAILINTQLENSEIIRSDGNEFLIYLIGYQEKQIKTYLNKLAKEFEKLPYNFGAAMGYKMIEDEISTIDDAINDATINMRVDKENFK